MKKFLILATAALTLTGCTAAQGGVDSIPAICKHEDAERQVLYLAELAATQMVDPVKREAALGAVRVARAVLDKCP